MQPRSGQLMAAAGTPDYDQHKNRRWPRARCGAFLDTTPSSGVRHPFRCLVNIARKDRRQRRRA